MPNNSHGTSWRRWRWLDKQRSIAWVSPIGSLIIFVLTMSLPVFLYIANFVEDSTGVSMTRKASITILFIVFFLCGVYVSFGFYKMFFIELRQKFIAREVTREGSEYRLKGYYFKKAGFNPSELKTVEEYLTDTRLGRDIVTMLSWTPGLPNYKITLKDGRFFYLSGHIEAVEELKEQLQAAIESNLNSSAAE